MTKHVETERLVRGLVGDADTFYFKLGGLLAEAQSLRLDRKLPFDERYVSRSLRLKYRRAMYLINIYQKCRDARIPEAWLKGLAWSKAKEIARLPLQDLHANFRSLAEYAKANTRQDLVAKINREFRVSRRSS